MPKTKEDYVRDIMDVWNVNRVVSGSKNTEIWNLADIITGRNDKKDTQEVAAIQNAINSVQSPFELTWGEAISAFFKGAFSLNSSVQAEREIIVAGKLADAIVPAVEKYESEKQQLNKEIVYDQTMKFSPEANVLPKNYEKNNVGLKQMDSQNALTGRETIPVVGDLPVEQSKAQQQSQEIEKPKPIKTINNMDVYGKFSEKVATSKGGAQGRSQTQPTE